MTDPVDHPAVPALDVPFEDAGFEVETETMPDGRLIHYYRWPEDGVPPAEEAEAADV
jgi:hypothetical protein